MKRITASSVYAYQQCPRKFELKYVQGWRKVEQSEALYFGSLIHAGLECLWKGEDWLKAVKDGARDEYDHAKALAMLEGYIEFWGRPEPEETVEQEFELSIPDPDHPADEAHDHPTYVMAGKWDVGPARSLIVEHKTTSESLEAESTYWQKLESDFQVSHYTVAGMLAGKPIQGLLYDVLKKPTSKPKLATPPEKRRMKKDGSGYYAGVRLKDETPGEYHARLTKDIGERPSYYYARRTATRLDRQFADHLKDVWDWAFLFGGPFPRNTSNCVTMYGRCAFYDVCHNGLDLEVRQDLFKQLDDVHPELQVAEPHDSAGS